MATFPAIERRRIDVRGAADALNEFTTRLASSTAAGIAAARTLAAADVDWRSIRSEITSAESGIILAEERDGPALAARHFHPAVESALHDHGAPGAALVVEGRNRYERFERSDRTTAQLESIHDLDVGDVVWWGTPPDDVHRQRGLGAGAIELVLLAGPPTDPDEILDTTPPQSEMSAALVTAFLDGDTACMEPWYHDDVVLDANVPEWRFQVRGRRALLDALEAEEFSKPDRRLFFLRVTDTTRGLLLETELRFTEQSDLRVCREAHHLLVRDGLVAEHMVWCTGIADSATARTQFETAPVERL